MDPTHITEFASERFFSKLNQLNDTGSGDQAPDGQVSSSSYAQSQSPFILPHRRRSSFKASEVETRPPEPKKTEKKGLFGLRSKFLHSKSSQAVSDPSQVLAKDGIPVAVPRSTTRRRSTTPLDELFLNLPNELQIQIINSLPLADILNLRLASKSWHALITLNEAPIVRHHLDHHVPAYALRLYPASDASHVNFHHLCGIWHRLHVAAKLSYLMCDWISEEIFLRKTKAQRLGFAKQRERMYRRLIPLLFTLFHFFEMYRKLHLEHILEHGGYGLRHEPYTVNPIEAQIMSMYDDQTLLRVHQTFPLIISSFLRQLRPPSYVGRVERSLRGYLREKAPDEVHVAILCLGGMRQVERFWEIKGYNTRRAHVDTWYSGLCQEAAAEPEFKRSIKTLGRKKSLAAIKQATLAESQNGVAPDDSPCNEPPAVAPVPNPYQGFDFGFGPISDPNPCTATAVDHVVPGRHTSTRNDAKNPGTSPVFNTSLAAGMPMPPLSNESARHLLPDLPQLQSIWSTTAEALILDRKIVARSQDIFRNQQVMLELIREDGVEEDEWLYGRSGTDSGRLPFEEALLDSDNTDGLVVG